VIEDAGHRIELPEGVYMRRNSTHWDSNHPEHLTCQFLGDEDQADAAGNPPGMADDRAKPRISEQERRALIDLFHSTGGPKWKHKVGWLGPAGTECDWHGVRCGWEHTDPAARFVSSLDLYENGLVGRVPAALDGLEHLEDLLVFGNRLEGRLPEGLLKRMQEGQVSISADPRQLSEVTQIEHTEEAVALLCGHRHVVLRSDGRARRFVERCRNETPDDRRTFCEVTDGEVSDSDFARLALFLEAGGYFELAPEYSRNITDAGLMTTRVAKGDQTTSVVSYATEGPNLLWAMRRAIEGVAAEVKWGHSTEQAACPERRVEAGP
jgi:hypothetical protein